MAADGSIVIESKLDNAQAEKELDRLIKFVFYVFQEPVICGDIGSQFRNMNKKIIVHSIIAFCVSPSVKQLYLVCSQLIRR